MKIHIFKLLISLAILLNVKAFAISYVSLSSAITEIIYALSAQNNLIGVSAYCNYPKEVKNKTIIGDDYFINIEKIIKLKPDYILALNSAKILLSQLNLAQSKPMYFEFSNIDDIYFAIEKIAKISNKEENSKKLINDIKEKIEKNKSKNPKKILYIVQFNPLITIGNKSYINDVIEKSNNINVTSNINFSYPTISLEYAIKTKPDVVVVCFDNPKDDIKKFFPNSKIIKLNSSQIDIINRSGPRVWQAVEIFSNL